MAGKVRPLSPSHLQQPDLKIPRTDNPKIRADSTSAESSSPHPFPDPLHVSAGIEQVGPSTRISNVPQNIKTLIEALEADELHADESGAAEIAAAFYATKEVQAMGTLLSVQPLGCQNYISRYFALEKKGASHVNSLKSKVFSHDIKYNQIPLLRFLPFCTNLQRLKVSIEITDIKPFAEILRSLASILKRHETLKEFKLLLCKRTIQVLNNEREIGSVGDLLSILLELPEIEIVQIENLLPECDLIGSLYETSLEKLKDKLVLEPKNRCKVLLIDGPRIELNKHIKRAELDHCIAFLQSILEDGEEIKDKISEEDMKNLCSFIPEIKGMSNFNLREMSVYYVNQGIIQSGFWQNYRGLDGSPLGFPSLDIQQGYLSVMVERSAQN